jgi:hypothetical protein
MRALDKTLETLEPQFAPSPEAIERFIKARPCGSTFLLRARFVPGHEDDYMRAVVAPHMIETETGWNHLYAFARADEQRTRAFVRAMLGRERWLRTMALLVSTSSPQLLALGGLVSCARAPELRELIVRMLEPPP